MLQKSESTGNLDTAQSKPAKLLLPWDILCVVCNFLTPLELSALILVNSVHANKSIQLHILAEGKRTNPHKLLLVEIIKQDKKVNITTLLKKPAINATLNRLDDTGYTALHHALLRANMELVSDLITAGADPAILTQQADINLAHSMALTDKWPAESRSHNRERWLKILFQHCPAIRPGGHSLTWWREYWQEGALTEEQKLHRALQQSNIELAIAAINQDVNIFSVTGAGAHVFNIISAWQSPARKRVVAAIVNKLTPFNVNRYIADKPIIHWLAYFGYVDLLDQFLKINQVQVNLKKFSDSRCTTATALSWAKSEEVAVCLIKAGASFHQGEANQLFQGQQQPESTELVQALVEYLPTQHLDTARFGSSKYPLIVWLVWANKELSIVGRLLKRGANPNTLDAQDKTALHYAVEANNFPAVALLLSYAGLIHPKDNKNNPTKPAVSALQIAQFPALFRLLVAEFRQERSAVFYVDSADLGRLPLLHWTVELASKLPEGVAESYMKTLATSGADLHEKAGIFQQTALHRAVVHGNFALVNQLIMLGININEKDRLENTALHYAVLEGYGNVFRFLLEQGADATCKNQRNKTPYDLAADLVVKKKSIYQMFSSLGASHPSMHSGTVNNILEDKKFNPPKENVRKPSQTLTELNETPQRPTGIKTQIYRFFSLDSELYYAAQAGNSRSVIRLLQRGYDVNHIYIGSTALFCSFLYGKPEITLLLLEHGADPNAAGASYREGHENILQSVMYWKRMPEIKLLAFYGASAEQANIAQADVFRQVVIDCNRKCLQRKQLEQQLKHSNLSNECRADLCMQLAQLWQTQVAYSPGEADSEVRQVYQQHYLLKAERYHKAAQELLATATPRELGEIKKMVL